MRKFTPIANAILFDGRLSLGARVAYPALRHMAWEQGRRREHDAVPMPSLDKVAERVGCSRTSLKGYVAELRRVGLVVTIRRQHQGMAYLVYDAEATGAELKARRARAESDLELGQNPARSPSRVDRRTTEDVSQEPPHSPPALVYLTEPPPTVLIDQRNLPVDALSEACGIVDGSPRVRQAVTAINGRGAATGIRGLFWRECYALAETTGRISDLALLQADPERFAHLLADRIRRKARLIRERQPWRTSLAPSVVHDLWLDIEHAEPDSGLTPAEMAAFPG